MTQCDYDICVIGGGVNGAGIARDAAGRGFSTVLVEAQDLASATSSSSTKLIHGGLRYLEHYDFKLVRESLLERDVLLRAAPHIIWPLDFVLPHSAIIRPYWLIRLGLFIYDFLGKHSLIKRSRALDLQKHPYGAPLKRFFRKGLTYQDCWVEDSRLVVLNAQDARARGADIMTYTGCSSIEKLEGEGWRINLRDMMSGDEFFITAKSIVNAAGPWVRSVLEGSELQDGSRPAPGVRLVKGSHIIVEKLYDGKQAYILQQTDRRIVFAIPYEKHYTLIGTTDVDYQGDPSTAMCTEEEIEYLCAAVNVYFDTQIKPQNVLWTYSGVRPLIQENNKSAREVSRGYKFHLDESHGAPILSVYGGKITTFRKLAEHAMDKMCEVFEQRVPSWTDNYALPGGRIPPQEFDVFMQKQIATFSWLPPAVVMRLVHTYGSRMDTFMGHATQASQLGRHYGDGIYEAELVYSIHYEFTRTAEDYLWRRTKMGLHASPQTVEKLQDVIPELVKKVTNHG
jgi:glycerol-3-phosphate dehydrogenase